MTDAHLRISLPGLPETELDPSFESRESISSNVQALREREG